MLKQIDYQGSLEEVANKFQGRKAEVSEEVNKSVQEIVNAIRKEGDSALFSYAKKFDGYNADKNNLLVTRKEREEGLEKLMKITLEFCVVPNHKLKNFISIN